MSSAILHNLNIEPKYERPGFNFIKRLSLSRFDLSIPSLHQPLSDKLKLPLLLSISDNRIRCSTTQTVCHNSCRPI